MIGAMRDRIVIKSPVSVPAPGAGADTHWEAVLSDWCQAVPLSSDKRLTNSQYQLQDGFHFIIRYRSGFTPTKSMLVEYNGADYSVDGITEIADNRRRFIQITGITNGDQPQTATT
jgi:SPP1 family predicted phage head-tail adaptor